RARHLSSSHVADFQNGLNAPRLKFAFNLGFSLGKFFAVELRPLPLRSGLEARPLPIRLCLLGELKPGRRQAVKAEAAKRGRDSASLYGLTPSGSLSSAAIHQRPRQTASNSRFGRHATGSAIQRLMSDSRQPLPLMLILICGGNV